MLKLGKKHKINNNNYINTYGKVPYFNKIQYNQVANKSNTNHALLKIRTSVFLKRRIKNFDTENYSK